jgi:hypothetical protein
MAKRTAKPDFDCAILDAHLLFARLAVVERFRDGFVLISP